MQTQNTAGSQNVYEQKEQYWRDKILDIKIN